MFKRLFEREVPEIADGTVEMITVNPTGYQYVLYATIALYIVALLISVFLVRSPKKEENA